MIFDKCGNRTFVKDGKGVLVGEIRYWTASIDEQHMYDFIDHETQAYAKFEGAGRVAVEDMVEYFYFEKGKSVGFLKPSDPKIFLEHLNNHSITFTRMTNDVFFFYSEEELNIARILV